MDIGRPNAAAMTMTAHCWLMPPSATSSVYTPTRMDSGGIIMMPKQKLCMKLLSRERLRANA